MASKRVLLGGLLASFLTLGSLQADIIVGSDGSGPVQLFAADGTQVGTFGPADGSASALDSAGGLFVAMPGDPSSTVDEYGPSQNLLGSFTFTAPTDSRPYASYIVDMSWGSGGTLWISTFSGEVYNLSASGGVLSSFDTGDPAPGVAFDGTFLYTTSGPSYLSADPSMASPFVYERTTSGTIDNTIDTGLNDTLGIAYDPSVGAFWIGGFDTLSEVGTDGTILNTYAIDGAHYGVEAGTIAAVAVVPEPAEWPLLLLGLAALAAWKWRSNLRTVCKGLLCVGLLCAVSATVLHAAVKITSLTPNPVGPQPVGTSITLTAVASDTDAGLLRYRFRVGPVGGSLSVVRDYSPSTSVVWTPVDTDGMYEIEVSVLNRTTGSTLALSDFYTLSSRVTGASPVVNKTNHPLVALYSAPSCPAGSTMRVRFKLPSDTLWQSTPLKSCNGKTSMNFYIAGMHATSTYQLRQDEITGPHIVSGPILSFTTGAISIALPTPSAILPLKPPSSTLEGVTLYAGLSSLNVSDRPYAIDANAQIIWYAATTQAYVTRPVPGGDFLVTYGFTTDLGNSGLREYDLAGNLVKETNVEQMNAELTAAGKKTVTVFHHEIRKLANGNYLLLAMREVASSVQGTPNDIAGDMILVLDPNLQLLWAWDSFDHLDINRPAVLGETCGNGPGLCVLFNSATAHDWTHGNSAAITPDGNIIYSSRHQDFVYKIDYQNGSGDGHIIWTLGKGGDFTWVSSDPYPWFSHQHDAEYESGNTISVFDDGNTRVHVEGSGNSRGQALTLDEVNKVVTPILNVDLGAYSLALGSAQRLQNGNYFFGNGYINGSANTQSSEWTTSAAAVSNIHSNSVNYRSFRLRDLYSAPY